MKEGQRRLESTVGRYQSRWHAHTRKRMKRRCVQKSTKRCVRRFLVSNFLVAIGSNLTHRPANVPQRHANQATHARYAAHARTFFLIDFVSVENKGSKIQLPKLKVASSSLVARSNFVSTGFNWQACG